MVLKIHYDYLSGYRCRSLIRSKLIKIKVYLGEITKDESKVTCKICLKDLEYN